LIIIPPHYGSGTNDGTPAGRNKNQPGGDERRNENQPSQGGYQSKGNKRRHKNQPGQGRRQSKGNERRNEIQDVYTSREDEATIHFIQSKSEETIKHRVEDILLCVDHKTQGLHEEFTEKIDETHLLDSGQLAIA
jgi:hypothetical protein